MKEGIRARVGGRVAKGRIHVSYVRLGLGLVGAGALPLGAEEV